MSILLTNDDGIHAAGLHALRSELVRLERTEVVAPDRECSAIGHGITVHRPLRVDEVTFPGPEGRGWAVDGTPSDCVKLALDALLEEAPRIVISGVNSGRNVGTDILYSGTVSAAIEGSIAGIPSIAVSLASYESDDYALAARFTRELARIVVESGLTGRTLLNVNVPSLEGESVAGAKLTRLGTRTYENVFDRRVDPRGRVYYWLAGEAVEHGNAGDTDVEALREKMISITPLHLDLTDYRALTEMEGWDEALQEAVASLE